MLAQRINLLLVRLTVESLPENKFGMVNLGRSFVIKAPTKGSYINCYVEFSDGLYRILCFQE